MQKTNVTVEQLGSKSVNTKFGPKPTFSFKADGEWFSTGFTNSRVAVGDVVTFDYNVGTYGNEVDGKAVSKTGGTAVVPATPTAAPATFTRKPMGAFPIPALDGQRAIVRQNSLTNAVNYAKGLPQTGTVEEIIAIARQFEAYSCGDLDREEAEAEVAAASKPKKVKAASA